MRDFLKMGIILMSFSIVVALVLGVVYLITLAPIQNSELKEKLDAIKIVLIDPINHKSLVEESNIPKTLEELDKKIWKNEDSGIIYTNEKYKGLVYSPAYLFKTPQNDIYVLSGASIGYGGNVKIMASFIKENSEWKMLKIEVLDFSQETPGLGAKVGEQSVKDRFSDISQSGLDKAVRVNADVPMAAAKDNSQRDEYRKDGVISVSDIMTGATITPRAVANAINTMYDYLQKNVKGE